MTAKPCADCVELHGDATWLEKWPEGAEFRVRHQAHLCDGCADERTDQLQTSPDEEAAWAAIDYERGTL